MILPASVVQEVAGAVVAMHHGDLLRRRWRIAAQAADRGADDRLRMPLVALDHPLPVVERHAPAIGEGGGRAALA